MGRVQLVYRLAARDLRRRPAEAALLLLAMTAATTTLTLGLVLHGVISRPYQTTRGWRPARRPRGPPGARRRSRRHGPQRTVPGHLDQARGQPPVSDR